MQNYKTMPQHNIDNAVQARAISIETALILHSKLLHQPFKESYTQLSEKNSRSIATIFCLPPNLYPPPLQKLILKRRVYILSSVVINCQSYDLCFDVTMTYNFSNFFFQGTDFEHQGPQFQVSICYAATWCYVQCVVTLQQTHYHTFNLLTCNAATQLSFMLQDSPNCLAGNNCN